MYPHVEFNCTSWVSTNSKHNRSTIGVAHIAVQSAETQTMLLGVIKATALLICVGYNAYMQTHTRVTIAIYIAIGDIDYKVNLSPQHIH